MSRQNKTIGAWGEKAAADYLESQGYEILARNVWTPYGEIDIVARQAEITIFIEVKTRTSKSMGPPEQSVNQRKQQHMLAAGEYYCAEHHIDHWQLDVLSVEGKPGATPVITHFENAVS